MVDGESDVRITALYAQQYEICLCLQDRHLFQQLLEDLLKSNLGSKQRFSEKAEFLFEELAQKARKGQQHIHTCFPSKQQHPTGTPTTHSVVNQTTRSTNIYSHLLLRSRDKEVE